MLMFSDVDQKQLCSTEQNYSIKLVLTIKYS